MRAEASDCLAIRLFQAPVGAGWRSTVLSSSMPGFPSIPFEEIDIVSLRKQQVHLLRRGFKYIDFWLDL